MKRMIIFLLISLACVYAFPAMKDQSTDEAINDEFIENMYRKEIEEGDNAEEPIQETKSNKHRNAKKKHLHGHFGGPFGHGFDSHGLGHGMDYPISHLHGIHGPIGHPVMHHGYGTHHGHHMHDPVGHPVVISPGHGHELPIIFPHEHHHHQHHHPHHAGHYPNFMPMPYPMPLCVMEKEDDKKDDKKKDDKKKDDKKKTKRQLVPCHYYGPPGAGWGAFTPGHTGAGWGAPYWY